MTELAAISVSGLTKRYGGVVAVNAVGFTLLPNEVVCIIGPNGAGKSSLVAMLSGMSRPSAGEIFVGEDRMTGRSTDAFCRQGVVQKFQGTNTFRPLSVRDNLTVAGLGVAGYRPGPDANVDEILDLIGLSHRADAISGELPHGQRQWLELGMTLMCQPRVLLLDEPAAGLSTDETRKIAAIIGVAQRRSAIIVIEHDMAFVRSLDCRTLVMHQGALIREGSFHDIEKDQEVRDIYLGREAHHVRS